MDFLKDTANTGLQTYFEGPNPYVLGKYAMRTGLRGAAMYGAYRGARRTLKRKRTLPTPYAKRRKVARKGSKVAPTGITTFHSDYKTTYKGKGRRRVNKGYKRFRSNLLRHLPSQKYHYNGSMTWVVGANNQNFFGWTTYGFDGTGGVDGTGDLLDLVNRAVVDNNVPANVEPGTFQDRRYFVNSLSGRAVITNTGTNDCVVEVYTAICRKDLATAAWGTSWGAYMDQVTNTAFNNPILGNSRGAQSVTQTAAAVNPTRTTVGMTPFQFRPFCQHFNIVDSKRFMLQATKAITFNFRDSKQRQFKHEDALGLLFRKGWTKVYLVRQWGETTAAGTTASQVTCEIEKDYNIKVLEQSVPRLTYISYTNNSE